MLALQVAFSACAVYLVATAGATGWLRLVGRVLGAETSSLDATQDHYATLGVSPQASATELAEAFLARSRRAAGQPERLAAVSGALAVLSDPLRRARYDVVRQEAAACCPPEPPAPRSAASARLARGKRGKGTSEAKQSKGGARIVSAAVLLGGGALALVFIAGGPSDLSTPGATLASAPGRMGPSELPNRWPRPSGRVGRNRWR